MAAKADPRADAERYWAEKGIKLAPQEALEKRAWEHHEAFVNPHRNETREQFWARREAEGTTFGMTMPGLRKKRGPSKEVLALRERVRELEARLTGHVAPPDIVEALSARVRELEGILNIVHEVVAA